MRLIVFRPVRIERDLEVPEVVAGHLLPYVLARLFDDSRGESKLAVFEFLFFAA